MATITKKELDVLEATRKDELKKLEKEQQLLAFKEGDNSIRGAEITTRTIAIERELDLIEEIKISISEEEKKRCPACGKPIIKL